MQAKRKVDRQPQLAYSEIQHKTHDEQQRRTKAAKIVAVLVHFFGSDDLSGLSALDIGCSTGYTVDVLAHAGADVVGVDIDVPGLEHATALFGARARFMYADGSALPFPDRSFDVVVFNHIYEHVVDPEAVMNEIRRVLKDDGAAYLGFGNKWQLVEPHYRLPFLSWLPRRAADRYVSAFKRGDDYYEQLQSRRTLLAMTRPLRVWDYTYSILADAERFNARDMVPTRLEGAPVFFWRSLRLIMPTFIWIGTPGTRTPQGLATRSAPKRIA